MRSAQFLALIVVLAAPRPAAAQHDHHHAAAADTTHHEHAATHEMVAAAAPGQAQAVIVPPHEHDIMARHPLGYAHGRQGSGTSWLPDQMPTFHLVGLWGRWSFMGHGALYGGHVEMNGLRGDEENFGPNMFGVMASRNFGERTLWQFSGMFSADPATIGGEGYPLLFQTGETWDGVPLVDHQHPHNWFSELSAAWTYSPRGSGAIALYAAPVGEPALGPPAFPHRPLGFNDPLAPIGHHWQDATHIAYGVATAGIQLRSLQVEGSTFNGREPGEDRAEIRAPEFDSFSGRVSWNPSSTLALQVSHGYLHRPEEAHPDHDTYRTTASAIWVLSRPGRRWTDLSLIWGRNREDGADSDSWLIEGESASDRGLSPFFRLESVQKTAQDLVLPLPFTPDQTFEMRQVTIGAVLGTAFGSALSWAIGGQAVISLVPDELRDVYGKDPGGWTAFLRIRPRRSDTEHMH